MHANYWYRENLVLVVILVLESKDIYYSKEPKCVTSSTAINSHSFMQTLTNQKSSTVSSWLKNVNKLRAVTLLGSLL